MIFNGVVWINIKQVLRRILHSLQSWKIILKVQSLPQIEAFCQDSGNLQDPEGTSLSGMWLSRLHITEDSGSPRSPPQTNPPSAKKNIMLSPVSPLDPGCWSPIPGDKPLKKLKNSSLALKVACKDKILVQHVRSTSFTHSIINFRRSSCSQRQVGKRSKTQQAIYHLSVLSNSCNATLWFLCLCNETGDKTEQNQLYTQKSNIIRHTKVRMFYEYEEADNNR